MNTISKYLSQRYPIEKNNWKIIIPISVFIGLFLVVFQPFGLDDLLLKYKGFKLAGYGLVTFFVLIINLVLIPRLFPLRFKEEKWTVIREILFLLWILFTVGLGNFLYSSLTMGFTLTTGNLLIFQAFTLAVGIIPITVLTMIKQNYLNRKNRESARVLTSSIKENQVYPGIEREIRISSENEKENAVMKVQDLLFIKSDGNYITVGYLKNGKITRALLRNTMKYAVDLLGPYPFIFQCHRSWLVNLHRISEVLGNSQGLRIIIDGFEEEIPVARKIMTALRQAIADIA
jgi:DNA-binding LytR/AlgR family response regulator